MNSLRKRRCIQAIGIILCLLMVAGCSPSKGKDKSTYKVYYLNKDATRIIEEEYEPKSSDTDDKIQEFITMLSSNPDKVEYRKPIKNGIEVQKYTLDSGQLSLIFSDEYSQMDVAEEILCRAAIVRTMTQIPDVSCVSFYIGDVPLSDSKGNVIGLMTNKSFVENPGEQINAIKKTTIHLYFANKTGDGLVRTSEKVQYSSNMSLEKVVMEHLLEGPKVAGMQAAVPQGTGLLSVTTKNGICYVNLDEGFMNQHYEIQEPIVIYSIVNSLSEISNVNNVQISVNGDTKGNYRDSYSLDTLYERNEDFIEHPQEAKESETQVKE